MKRGHSSSRRISRDTVFSLARVGLKRQSQLPIPASIAAARDLMEVTGVAKQMEGMISAMSQGFAKGAGADGSEKGKQAAAEFDAAMKKFMSYKDRDDDRFRAALCRDLYGR